MLSSLLEDHPLGLRSEKTNFAVKSGKLRAKGTLCYVMPIRVGYHHMIV
eukprot:COSAG01_NODE_3620_length_5860_cov_9.682173_4_plen_49_part_00